jgi:hypothetical protein
MEVIEEKVVKVVKKSWQIRPQLPKNVNTIGKPNNASNATASFVPPAMNARTPIHILSEIKS